MKSSWAKVLVCLFALVVLAVIPASAQMTVGTVTGTVADSTGAVIPGATVRLINEDTGVTREVQTDATGRFNFQRIRTGHYKLSVGREGFRTHEVRELEVSVGKVSELGEIRLDVGPTTEVVTIEAGAVPMMQADSPEITGNYPARVVSDVNFGTMGLDTIAFLTAGIVPGFGNINTNTGTGGQFPETAPAASGQRARSTQFNIDGHEINDITLGGPSIFVSNQDTVAEYQVSVNNYDASQGRLPGAQINIITKSGSNDVHGTLYYFYESAGTRAKSSAESRFFVAGDDKPKFVFQNYGATGGGPLIKNKWFVFGSFQRARVPDSASALVLGTALNMTQASATALAAATPNDATRLLRNSGPFSIPDGNPRCTPGTTQVITFGATPVTACGITRNVPQGEIIWEYSLRMDVALAKHNFNGKWFHQQDNFCCSGGSNGYWIAIPFNAWSISFGHTYQVTPRMINDFRFNSGRFFVAFEGGPNTIPGAFQGTSAVRGNLARINLPAAWNDFGLATNLPQGRLLYNFQWSDAVSYIWGKHTLKAGMEVRRNRTTAPFLPTVNGQYNYSGAGATFITQVLTDGLNSVNFADGPFTFQPFETDQFYFIQDDIRLRPNFTLNVGLRYEYTGQPINSIHSETVARESGPGFFWNTTLPLALRTFPRISGDKNNWGPRIGFAYTPRIWKRLFGADKTVIRGGYLVAYEASFYNILLNVSTAAPRVFLFSPCTTAATCTVFGGIQGGGTGAELAATAVVPAGTRDPREFNRTDVPTGFHSPYTENWSLGIQREFGANIVGEVRYVGSRQIGQFQSINANPRFSTFPAAEVTPTGAVPCPASARPTTFTLPYVGLNRLFCDSGLLRSRINGGKANYHGLQSRLDFRNLWNQFTGGTSFTWSKTIDNVSEIFGFFGNGSIAFSENPFKANTPERGLSNIHLGRVFTAFWIWDAPWRREQQGAAGKILGGWQINGQLFLYDGRPWTPITFFGGASALGINCGQDNFASTFAGIVETCRPYLLNPAAPVNTVTCLGATCAALGLTANPNAHWAINDGSGGFHGVGRNPNVYGDNVVLTNISFFKNTKFGKENKYNLQFRFLTQNLFNHRNFGSPDNFIDDSAGFGLADVDASFARPERNDVPGRLIRFGLHFVF